MLAQRGENRCVFPHVHDEICVKWIVKGKTVWWPACVTHVEPIAGSSPACRGSIMYHKLGDYESEASSVIFTTSSREGRIVSTTEGETQASWVFVDEPHSSDDDEDDRKLSGSSSLPVRRGSMVSKGVRKGSSRPTSKTGRFVPSLFQPKNPTDMDDGDEVMGLSRKGNHSNRAPTGNISTDDRMDLDNRLRFLESQLNRDIHDKRPSSSSTLDSVITALRWALLRSLEKPLKAMNLPDLATHGLASYETKVTTQCDYYTFRDLAKALHNEHKCTSNEYARKRDSRSRIAFSPSYNTTQSGSSATDNMNIVFSCLADVTSFLRIRDDNDFETILSKEVITATSKLLRIVGTHCIVNDADTFSDRQTSTTSTTSINASSELTSVINLFIGTAPIHFIKDLPGEDGDSTAPMNNNSSFRTSIIHQECKHYSSHQLCYQTPWEIKDVK